MNQPCWDNIELLFVGNMTNICLTKLDKYIRSAHSATERSSAYPICLCLIDKRYLRSAEGKFETLQLTITFQASFGVPVSAQQSTNHQFRFVKTHVPPAEGRCTHSNWSEGFNVLFLALSFPLIFTADEWIAILAETRPVIGSFLLKWVPFSSHCHMVLSQRSSLDRCCFFLLCCF